MPIAGKKKVSIYGRGARFLELRGGREDLPKGKKRGEENDGPYCIS